MVARKSDGMKEIDFRIVFTGIIEARAKVVALEGGRLQIERPPAMFQQDAPQMGESIAVDGCCLTVVASDPYLEFDLSPETLKRTAFSRIKTGHTLNLERAMRADGRLGGHIVQGHVDGVGDLVEVRPEQDAHVYRFAAGPQHDRYLIDKGSISINGISLTVVEPGEGEFDTWIIPHTLAETNLEELKVGDPVNLEFDVVAKYLEKLAAANLPPRA